MTSGKGTQIMSELTQAADTASAAPVLSIAPVMLPAPRPRG
jgi:hypothetical protein